MKKIIGIFISFLVITLLVILILHIWGISIISFHDILRSGITIGILCIGLVILIVLYGFFFRKEKIGNDKRK